MLQVQLNVSPDLLLITDISMGRQSVIITVQKSTLTVKMQPDELTHWWTSTKSSCEKKICLSLTST